MLFIMPFCFNKINFMNKHTNTVKCQYCNEMISKTIALSDKDIIIPILHNDNEIAAEQIMK